MYFMEFGRIVISADTLVGKPRIKGTRIGVDLIVSYINQGATIEWLIEGYPHITKEDIEEAVEYNRIVLKGKYK
jgi:uncharacterized protein (DUF433 family)